MILSKFRTIQDWSLDLMSKIFIMYYIFLCEKICIQGICILGEVKEEEDEEDGRASPPPFQPGAQQPPASGAASISDRYHGCMGVTMPSMTPKEKPPINVVGKVTRILG